MDKEFKNAAQQLGAPDETINYKFGPLNIYLYTMKPWKETNITYMQIETCEF